MHNHDSVCNHRWSTISRIRSKWNIANMFRSPWKVGKQEWYVTWLYIPIVVSVLLFRQFLSLLSCHRLEWYDISLQPCQHTMTFMILALVLRSKDIGAALKWSGTHIPLDRIRSRFTTAGAAHQSLEWIGELVGSEHSNIGQSRNWNGNEL